MNFLADLNLIPEKVTGFIKDLIDKALNYFYNNIPWWAQALILVALIILVVLGFIFLVVKSWKLLLVLIVLAGIGAAIYFFVIKKGDGGDSANVIFTQASFILKSIL